jgi:hypothetical protein
MMNARAISPMPSIFNASMLPPMFVADVDNVSR